MTSIIDVYRHFSGLSTRSDSAFAEDLASDAMRHLIYGDTATTIFQRKPAFYQAYRDNDAMAMAAALGVPWPVPENVTLQSLAADLEALAAKVRAFAGPRA